MRRLGIIAAPGWMDPTAADFLTRHPEHVEIAQTILGPAGHDMSFATIRSCEPHLLEAARLLVEAGCECIAQVGPIFAYQAGGSATGAQALGLRLSESVGVPVVLNGCAVLGALEELGIRRFAAVCPYYDAPWKAQFLSFMENAGYRVGGGQSFVDLGIFPSQDAVDARRYVFSEDEVLRAIQLNVEQSKQPEAVVVTGSGVRTLSWLPKAQERFGIPVISADAALYSAVVRTMQLSRGL